MPQIAAKIPEVVETVAQEDTSDDLPEPQVAKENLEVIKVPQEREGVPQLTEGTAELVKVVSKERVQQRTAETGAVVGLAARERVQRRGGVGPALTSATAEPSLSGRDRRVVEVGLTGTSATANCRKNWRSTVDGKPRPAFAAYSGAGLRGSCRS